MAVTWKTSPVDISIGTTGSWTDIDLAALIPSGTTGVILQIVNTSGSGHNVGWRKNGSGDDRYTNVHKNSVFWVAIGVDASRIFEMKVANLNVDCYLHGSFDDDAVFLTNATFKTAGTGSWLDIDISGDTGGATAIAAIVEFNVPGASSGLRENGSTDDRTGNIQHSGGLVSVDGSEIFEVKQSNNQTYLTGYVTKEMTWVTNAVDVSLSSTGPWINLSALPAGATGGVVSIHHSGSISSGGLRVDGDSQNISDRNNKSLTYGMVKALSLIIEGKIGNTSVNMYRHGHFEEAAAAGWTGKIIGVTDPAKISGIAVANIAKVNNVA